jgi:hypothetical protein
LWAEGGDRLTLGDANCGQPLIEAVLSGQLHSFKGVTHYVLRNQNTWLERL